jgi:hypothetical protein
MTKRADVVNPRVSRKVLPAVDLYTIDVESGTRIKKMVYCTYHRQMEWIADFYLESEPKSKNSDDVRTMCIEGWDITEGKLYSADIIKRPKPEPTATLMEFII